MVAGARSTTAETLRAALRGIGVRAGVRKVSSFMLMVTARPDLGDDGVLVFADCGVNPDPTAAELAEIAMLAAEQRRALPRPAAPRSRCSRSPPAAAPTTRARARSRRRRASSAPARPSSTWTARCRPTPPSCPRSAPSKAPGSAVAGRANVLVFPDLDSGNIGYKLVERIAGARAIGPILQGLARPANDLSRGCSVDDIVDLIAVTAVQAGLR